MEPGTLLILLLVLACPLLMMFMHRGGHGLGGDSRNEVHAHSGHSGAAREKPTSLEDLRRRRAELDAEIALREEAELTTPSVPDLAEP